MLCKHTPSKLNVLRHDARSLARGFAMAGTSAAACGVVWGLVCVREGTRAVDPAWYAQTPISEDKGPYSEARVRQRGGLQRFRARESSHQVATATTTAILPSVM